MDKNKRKNKVALIVVSVTVAIVIALGIAAALSQNTPKTDATTLSQGDAEQFCQDSALLGKYLDMKKVSVIDMENYNSQYINTGRLGSDGSKIMMLTWNGKVNDEKTGFVCNISGRKDDIKLHLLSVGGTDLYNTYNEANE